MKKPMTILIIILVLLAIAAAGWYMTHNTMDSSTSTSTSTSGSAQIQTLSPQDAKAKMDSGEAMTIVDVREPDEYAGGHIPNAVNISLGTITGTANGTVKGLPDKSAAIMVYCRTWETQPQGGGKAGLPGVHPDHGHRRHHKLALRNGQMTGRGGLRKTVPAG